MKTVLIQNAYKSGLPDRDSELLDCLYHNSRIGFDEFYLMADSGFVVKNISPSTRVPFSGIPSFSDILKLSSLPEMTGKLIIFSNSDIKLDSSILRLVSFMQDKDFCCISRYESDGRFHVNPKSSQDCWVYIGGKMPESLISQSDLRLGQLGVENRLANNFHSYGWRLYNPCLTVKNIHIDSQPKDYRPNIQSREHRVYGAYTFVLPCDISQVGKVDQKIEHLLYTVNLDRTYERMFT